MTTTEKLQDARRRLHMLLAEIRQIEIQAELELRQAALTNILKQFEDNGR